MKKLLGVLALVSVLSASSYAATDSERGDLSHLFCKVSVEKAFHNAVKKCYESNTNSEISCKKQWEDFREANPDMNCAIVNESNNGVLQISTGYIDHILTTFE